MPSVISTDVLIVGAGVAGLWLNARLRRLGYSTVLVERASLGGEQTLKSQGIIHGGALTSLMDTACGMSTLCVLPEFEVCPTLDLRILRVLRLLRSASASAAPCTPKTHRHPPLVTGAASACCRRPAHA